MIEPNISPPVPPSVAHIEHNDLFTPPELTETGSAVQISNKENLPVTCTEHPLRSPIGTLPTLKSYAPLFCYDKSRIEYPKPWPWNYHLAELPEPSDNYEGIRKDSHHLTDYAKTIDDNLSKKIDFFGRLDLSASRESDLLQVPKLVEEAYITALKMSNNATHVATYFRIQLGKIATIFQKVVKHQKLGRWKESFKKYFPNISYETINIYMKVANISGVEDWLFLGIWKLNKLRSACNTLGIQGINPIRDIGALLTIDLTKEFTEKELSKLVEREKFKKSVEANTIALGNEIIDDMVASDIDLNESLVKDLNTIQSSGGSPENHAKILLANKGRRSPIKKSKAIPDQLAFDDQVGPLLDTFKLLLKTPAVDIRLDYTRLDKLIEKAIQLDQHLSRNIHHNAA